MPVVYEEQQDQAQGQGQNVSGGSGIIGGSGGQAQTDSQAAPGQPSKSGSWTNLRQYLDANKPQAQQMAQNVAGSVRNEATEAQNELNTVKGRFADQVGSTGVAYGDEQKNLINQAVSAPVATLADENLSSQIANIRNAQYNAPKQLNETEGYGNYLTEAQQAREAVNLSENEAGRQQLLAKQYERPTYSSGEKKLDQLLLQNDPTARQEFSGLRSLIAGEGTGLDAQEKAAQDAAAQQALDRIQSTNDAKTALMTQLGGYDPSLQEGTGAIGDLMSQVYSNVGTREAAKQAEYDQLVSSLPEKYAGYQQAGLQAGSQKLSDQVYNDIINTQGAELRAAIDQVKASNVPGSDMILKRLREGYGAFERDARAKADAAKNELLKGNSYTGFNGQQYGFSEEMPDYMSQSYLAQPEIQADYQTTATADEVARANALSQLAGGVDIFGDPSLAGSYMAQKPSFDEELYLSDLAQRYGVGVNDLQSVSPSRQMIV